MQNFQALGASFPNPVPLAAEGFAPDPQIVPRSEFLQWGAIVGVAKLL